MTRSDPRVQAALFVGALVLYIATSTPGAFWLDSSELAAAGVTLGIPHAPGHPLYVILAHTMSQLPLGTVGFRLALLSALFGAISVVLLYGLTVRLATVVTQCRPSAWATSLPAIAFALSDALWFQSVRAEVYTLHLALALGLLVLAVDWTIAEHPRIEPIAVGALLLGLGAGNHHLLLVATTPALALLLLTDSPRRLAIRRALPGLIAAAAVGLTVYALLPLRALHEPLVNYGHPNTLGRFLDVVMAKVFTGSVTGTDTPWSENLSGALDMFMGSLGPIWLLLGPAGWYLIWRERRDIALALLLAVTANLATKLLMVLDPTNPDAAGYFQLAMAVTATCGGVALATMVESGRAGRIAAATATVCIIAAMAALWPAERTDLSGLRGPETVDTALHSDTPPGALVMSSFFAHHFNGLYQRTVAGYRPDIHPVHQGLEDHIDGGRPFADAARRRAPDLAPMLDAKLTTGTFPTDAIVTLASRRPVLLEPTLGLPISPEHLTFRSGLFAVQPQQSAENVDAQRRGQQALLTALGSEARDQRETLTTLALTWLPTAVTRLRQGSSAGATIALDGVDQLSPGSRWVTALREPTRALAAAEASGDAARLEATRSRLQRTDFTGLFGTPGR